MQKEEQSKSNFKLVNKITFGTLCTNFCLAFSKLFGGIFGASAALISDSINSFGDVITSFLSLLGNKLASKSADNGHQYGHEKIANIAVVIFEMFVIFSIGLMGYNSIVSLATGEYNNTAVPEYLALGIAAGCIFVKVVLFVISLIGYKKTKSSILQASSLDHILDSVGTTLSLIGISIAISFDIKWLDDAVSLLVVILVLIGAIKILFSNISLLIDSCWDDKHVEEIKNHVEKMDQIICVDSLKTRMFGDRVYVDIEVRMDKDLTLEKSHKVAEDIEKEIEEAYYEVIHVNVHVNPSL